MLLKLENLVKIQESFCRFVNRASSVSMSVVVYSGDKMTSPLGGFCKFFLCLWILRPRVWVVNTFTHTHTHTVDHLWLSHTANVQFEHMLLNSFCEIRRVQFNFTSILPNTWKWNCKVKVPRQALVQHVVQSTAPKKMETGILTHNS